MHFRFIIVKARKRPNPLVIKYKAAVEVGARVMECGLAEQVTTV